MVATSMLLKLATVAFGHLINAGLTIALAAAAAAITEHAATAAILTLTVTVGSWIINFIAAVQGGFWERVAGYTPTAMVAEFQHGLMRLDVVLIAVTLILLGLGSGRCLAASRHAVPRRIWQSIGMAALATALILSFTRLTDQLGQFRKPDEFLSRADEQALRQDQLSAHRGSPSGAGRSPSR